MKKLLSLVLSGILLVSLVSSVAEASAESVDDPYVKIYDNVEFTIVVQTPPGDVLPDGQTVEDNLRTRLFTKQTGLVPKVLWSASSSAFSDRMNVSIATGDIPDYMEVNYTQYEALLKNDLLADLTKSYNESLNPEIKKVYASADNADIDAVTKNGSIYGIPKANGLGDSSPILWVRQDWLDELELDAPKSIADIPVIAKAFQEKDSGNNGFPILPVYDAAQGGSGSTADIFTNYGATPGQWRLGDDGKVNYGSIMEEAIEPLELLNEWYEEGIIQPDFGSWTEDMLQQSITSGQTGMFTGYWWLSWGWLTDTVLNDPNTVWAAYALPKEAGDPYIGGGANPAGAGIGVVNKEFENPEVFIYALNDIFYAMKQPSYAADIEEAAVVGNAYTPMTIFPLPSDAIIQTGVLASGYAAGDISIDEVASRSFPSEAAYNVMIAENAKTVADSQNPHDDMEAWANSMGYTVGMMALHEANTEFIRTDFVGTTPTMESRQTFLDTFEITSYTEMIMGDTDGASIADYFADFAASYLNQGGSDIIDEVQESIDSN